MKRTAILAEDETEQRILMSLQLFETEIRRFVRGVEPEVLCITGGWGCGKTYSWTHYLAQAENAKEVGLPKVAYVSLFGRNSLGEVRNAIAENTKSTKGGPKRTNAEALGDFVDGALLTARLAKYIPFKPNLNDLLDSISFSAVSKQIVCFDDLERAGAGLETKLVMGLASYLAIERACKVVIILNKEKLIDGGVEFDAQADKVVDKLLVFDPTPEEASEIAIATDTPLRQHLLMCSRDLKITNIRIIRKAQNFCNQAITLLGQRDERLLKQAIHTLTLATFAKFDPETAPPLRLIKEFNKVSEMVSRSTKANVPSDDQSEAKSVLIQYGFGKADEFDLALIDGVENGFFNQNELIRLADIFQSEFGTADKREAFHLAWQKVFGSFEDNLEECVGELIRASELATPIISAVQLNTVLEFLTNVGRIQQAQSLLRNFIDKRDASNDFWQSSFNLFRDHLTDADLLEAFGAKFAAGPEQVNPKAVLKKLYEKSGWNPDDLSLLEKLSPGDFRQIFKEAGPEDFEAVVRGSLSFKQILNADEQMKQITKNAENALRLIASENQLNKKRVLAYGVSIDG